VMFAESTGTQMSKEIAEHLVHHASMLCETIDVGRSSDNKKKVDLPRERMHCSSTPKNPQRVEWTDSFGASVEGKTLTVNRTDSRGGWDQMLQLKCCDDGTSAEGKPKLEIPVPSVVMFIPHDERYAIYDGDLNDVHAIDRWVNAHRSPMILHLTTETAEHIFDDGPKKVPRLFLIGSDGQQALQATVKEAAKQLRGRVVICFSGVSSHVEKRLADLAGVEEGQLPILTLIEQGKAGGGPFHSVKKYRLNTHGLQANGIVDFITSYEHGQLRPYLRSEPVPEKEDMVGPVGILVGSTFSQVSQDPEYDVMVDFYAPWCGHCRKFEPQYKMLGKKLQHVKTLKIMKLDATRNEIEGMVIQGFPTIVLFQAGPSPKRQMRYTGNRQPEDMVRWLHQHCTKPFDDKAPKETHFEPVESGLLDASEEDL